MATDIHLFVEHRINPGDEYVSLSAGELNVPRDYDVFAALAGVRAKQRPLIAPRGFPEDASFHAHRGYYDRVSEEDGDFDGLWFIAKRADAQRLVDRGLSHMKSWRNVDLVSDPDAHDASWLKASELLAALRYAGIDPARLAPEYRVALSALDLLADRNSRVVFWFDN